MSRSELGTVIDSLDADEVTELLRDTDEETRENLLATLHTERRKS